MLLGRRASDIQCWGADWVGRAVSGPFRLTIRQVMMAEGGCDGQLAWPPTDNWPRQVNAVVRFSLLYHDFAHYRQLCAIAQ